MDTELALDASFSGARTIVCTIGRGDAERRSRRRGRLGRFIRLKLPRGARLDQAEDPNPTYTFTLLPQREEEYVQKVEACWGADPKCSSPARYPFSSGYRIERVSPPPTSWTGFRRSPCRRG